MSNIRTKYSNSNHSVEKWGANGTKTFPWLCQSYMQSFIKIGVLVLEKSAVKKMTLCNFNKDLPSLEVIITFPSNKQMVEAIVYYENAVF